MQRKFITNLALLLFLNLLIKPFWLLGIDRAVQNVTGAEVYGNYYALFNFSFLFNILLDLGITNFNNRNISRHRQLLQKHLTGIIMIRIALALFYAVISLIAALIIGYDFVQMKMVLVLLLNQALISFILYLRSNLAGLHLFRTDSLVSVLDRAIMIVLCGWLLWMRKSDEPFEIDWFIWAQTVAYVITIVLVFTFLSKKVKLKRPKWDKLFAMMILKQSYPYAILILLMTFYNRIDSVMLERMLPDGPVQAGIYAQAYRLMDASNMIAFLFAGLLLPMFSHMLKEKQDISQLLKLSYSLIAIPAITVATVSFFYRNEIMDLLYKEHVADSAVIFSFLMISFYAISTTYIFGTLLTANGNLRQLNIMATCGMALNILLNLVLIPHFFAKGAAIASLITQSSTALVQIILCIQIFGLRINSLLVLKYLVFAACSVLTAWFLKTFMDNWILSILVTGFICLAISMIIRIISIKSLRYILKNEL